MIQDLKNQAKKIIRVICIIPLSIRAKKFFHNIKTLVISNQLFATLMITVISLCTISLSAFHPGCLHWCSPIELCQPPVH